MKVIGDICEIKHVSKLTIEANSYFQIKNLETGITTVNIDTDDATIEMIITPKGVKGSGGNEK